MHSKLCGKACRWAAGLWLVLLFLPFSALAQDADGDGLNNLGEYTHSCLPNDSDTDGDGMHYRWEMIDACSMGKSSDGVRSQEEYQCVNVGGLKPCLADTQGDLVSGGREVRNLCAGYNRT